MGFDKLTYGWTVLFPIAVLLYYFFRKRYEVKTISSTLFWEQSMRETKVSPYLKNLQRNALFYLQMAALLLLLFILLGPFIKSEEAINKQSIFVVDTSASMLASKDGTALFEDHKNAMKELVEKRQGQKLTIITTGKEPTTIIRDEMDVEIILSTIEKLEVTYEHEFMDRAIEFTRSIATDSGADIHIFTDSFDRTMIQDGNDAIAWSIIGSEIEYDNVSIDKFGAVKSLEGTDAIIKLKNYAKIDREGVVTVSDAMSDEVLATQTVIVEAGSELLVTFKNLADGVALQAEIEIEDDYKTDNIGVVLLGHEATNALVDVQLHELVKKAFEAIGLSVATGSANELAAARDESIIITNDVNYLEQGTRPVILIGRNDVEAEEVKGSVTTISDPLFSIAELTDVYVSEVYPSFDEYETIAKIGNQPFIQKSRRGDIVILSDVEMTDWPLHPSFPLFMWSSVEMLGRDGATLGTFIPNERKSAITGGTTNEIEVYTIADEYVTTIPDAASFVAPSRPGIYQARDGDVEKLFVVQLEGIEKELEKGSSFRIGRASSEAGTESSKNMIGYLLILPVLMLLLLEWEVQRRRGYPN